MRHLRKALFQRVRRVQLATPSFALAEAIDYKTIRIKWGEVANAGVYVVEVSDNGSTGWSVLTSVLAPDFDYNHDVTTHDVTKYYRVKATNAGYIESNYSEVTSETTRFDINAVNSHAWFEDLMSVREAGTTDYVTQWTDLSGNSRHITEADTAKQPPYRLEVVDQIAGVIFDGAIALRRLYNNTNWGSLQRPFTIFMLGKLTHNISNTQAVMGPIGTTFANLIYTGSSQYTVRAIGGTSTKGFKSTSLDSNLDPAPVRLYTIVIPANNQPGKIRLNGVDDTTQINLDTWNDWDSLQLGCYGSIDAPVSGNVLRGSELCCLGFVQGDLTTNLPLLESIEQNYFGNKYRSVGIIGTRDPLPNLDIYIMAGQSEMMGRGLNSALPTELTAEMEDIFIFSSDNYFLNKLHAGVNNGGAASNEFGPEINFGYKLMKYKGRDVLFVKYAVSGTFLTTQSGIQDWNTGSTGEYYDLLKTKITAALSRTSVRYNPTIKGFFWRQGESDALTSLSATYGGSLSALETGYRTDLTNFINGIRTHIGNANLPFFVGRINNNIASAPGKSAVRAAQLDVSEFTFNRTTKTFATTGSVNALNEVYMYDTDSYPLSGDNLHSNAAGQLMQGEDFFEMGKAIGFY